MFVEIRAMHCNVTRPAETSTRCKISRMVATTNFGIINLTVTSKTKARISGGQHFVIDGTVNFMASGATLAKS